MLKIEALLKERFKKKWLESNHDATIEQYKANQKELESVVNQIMQKIYVAAGGAPGELLLECLVNSLEVHSLVKNSPEVERFFYGRWVWR